MFKLRRPLKKETNSNKEFWRSSSLPSSRRVPLEDHEDPAIKFMDDTNVQIIISSGHSSHEQTPVEATSAAASLQDENVGVNENTPQDERKLKRTLHRYALCDMWENAQTIYVEYPDMIRAPLNALGETALHTAVIAGSTQFVKGLVELIKLEEDLIIKNANEDTPFSMAAILGHTDSVKIMLTKSKNLPLIRARDEKLPVHLAALYGQRETMEYLSSDDLLRTMDFKDIQELFFIAIGSAMYNVAKTLLRKYRAPMAVSRDKNQLTALHLLARKSTTELDNDSETLIIQLWDEVAPLEWTMILELINQPSGVFADALRSGNDYLVKQLLYKNSELLRLRDSEGRTLLHLTVLYQRHSFFKFLLDMETVALIIPALDNEQNNCLHLAATMTKEPGIPNIQLHRKLMGFMEVEKILREKHHTPGLFEMKNKAGMTPQDVFYDTHKELCDGVEKAYKGTANCGMLVATLIATVAFAAALTVPGDKNNGWFVVFFLSNATALFSSSATIIYFFSFFTASTLGERDFVMSLHPRLILGLILLFISIATMVIAFSAASFLIFQHISKWVAYVVASLGLLPILVYVMVQITDLKDLLAYIHWFIKTHIHIQNPIQMLAIRHIEMHEWTGAPQH